jgi:RNA polymerase sigma factor (sigma-70 family)
MCSAGPGARSHAKHVKPVKPQDQGAPDASRDRSASASAGRRDIPVFFPRNAASDERLASTIELTLRARAGDQIALEALCLRCLKSLTRFAAGRLPPAARGMVETQDVVLEAVQRGMYRLHDLDVRHPGALIAYMRKILKNLIVDQMRTAVRRPPQVSLDERHADRGQSPLERVLDDEQIELYEAALERLKPRDAALVTLKIEEQLPYEEIATELEFPSANAARVAVKRAVLRLAHEMSRLSHARSGSGAAGAEGTQMRDLS